MSPLTHGEPGSERAKEYVERDAGMAVVKDEPHSGWMNLLALYKPWKKDWINVSWIGE